jgi:ribosomal protein S18 acetylase RimI-like enzyme
VSASAPDPDLARALDFVLRADMAGTANEPFRWGLSVRMPELPLRQDSNYLLVTDAPAGVSAADLAAEADRVQGAAGLRHRCLMLRDGAEGERLAPGFEALGWTVSRGVVMVQRRPPERAPEAHRVKRVDPGVVRAAREEEMRAYPWATPEVIRQLLSARALVPVETRVYAAFDGTTPASWTELYLDGGVGQIEAVATAVPYRRRGYASAVVLHAAEEARRAGALLVFLCADALGRPALLYGRLGFDRVGEFTKFIRPGGG